MPGRWNYSRRRERRFGKRSAPSRALVAVLWLDCRLGVRADFADARCPYRGVDRRRLPGRKAMGIESLRAAVVADLRDQRGPREPNGAARSDVLDAMTPC